MFIPGQILNFRTGVNAVWETRRKFPSQQREKIKKRKKLIKVLQ